ncbi:MAG TPA: hypothetical protein VJ729_09925 [Nitrososphaeraceae archaeon]|jgi:hypothetical protein|nr:hypothetical protein [Nitrososphaeraceae archaeon]
MKIDYLRRSRNEAIISDEHDSDKNEQQQQEVKSSNILIEQIDGTCYTFDTADCALMFEKFNAVYRSNFADE